MPLWGCATAATYTVCAVKTNITGQMDTMIIQTILHTVYDTLWIQLFKTVQYDQVFKTVSLVPFYVVG